MMEKVWFISDTHFYHNNIIKYCNRPEDHDSIMIQNWNKCINPGDLVIHVGDITAGLGKVENGKEILKETFQNLNGKKILVRGNHDHHKDKYYIEELGFECVVDYLELDEYFVCHYPMYEENEYTPYQEKQMKKVFENSNCKFLIHGHSHLTKYGHPRYNVSVDLHDFCPVNFEEIKETLNNSKEEE